MDVSFRRLEVPDLPLLHRWLNDPEVARWWEDEDLGYDAVVAKYTPRIDDIEHAEQWVAVVDGRDAGWLQTYALTDWPDYATACWAVGVHGDAGGFDYLLGDATDRGRGLGPVVIRAFLDQVVFGMHPWSQACAGPHPDNRRSWRALEKVGCRFVGMIDTEDGPERLMVIDRTIPT